MYQRNVVIFTLAVVTLGLAAYSQEQPKIKHVPTPNTDPASGVEMYRAYCAVCHGVDGKGSGPAASALKSRLPDLTLLSRKNGGKFPDFRVTNIIQGDAVIAAHGSKDMPMWGDVFQGLKPDESVVKLRIHNLTEYLASIQER
jgi:mono/diheme cytochrome c family protein